MRTNVSSRPNQWHARSVLPNLVGPLYTRQRQRLGGSTSTSNISALVTAMAAGVLAHASLCWYRQRHCSKNACSRCAAGLTGFGRHRASRKSVRAAPRCHTPSRGPSDFLNGRTRSAANTRELYGGSLVGDLAVPDAVSTPTEVDREALPLGSVRPAQHMAGHFRPEINVACAPGSARPGVAPPWRRRFAEARPPLVDAENNSARHAKTLAGISVGELEHMEVHTRRLAFQGGLPGGRRGRRSAGAQVRQSVGPEPIHQFDAGRVLSEAVAQSIRVRVPGRPPACQRIVGRHPRAIEAQQHAVAVRAPHSLTARLPSLAPRPPVAQCQAPH